MCGRPFFGPLAGETGIATGSGPTSAATGWADDGSVLTMFTKLYRSGFTVAIEKVFESDICQNLLPSFHIRAGLRLRLQLRQT